MYSTIHEILAQPKTEGALPSYMRYLLGSGTQGERKLGR